VMPCAPNAHAVVRPTLPPPVTMTSKWFIKISGPDSDKYGYQAT
jgi:hypothetical protein